MSAGQKAEDFFLKAGKELDRKIVDSFKNAGVGALMCLIVAIVVYKLYSVKKIWTILSDSMKESVMILMIIGASALLCFAPGLATWLPDTVMGAANF